MLCSFLEDEMSVELANKTKAQTASQGELVDHDIVNPNLNNSAIVQKYNVHHDCVLWWFQEGEMSVELVDHDIVNPNLNNSVIVQKYSVHHDCLLWSFQEGETSVEFANRIKAQIAARGGLVDLEWWVWITYTYALNRTWL